MYELNGRLDLANLCRANGYAQEFDTPLWHLGFGSFALTLARFVGIPTAQFLSQHTLLQYNNAFTDDAVEHAHNYVDHDIWTRAMPSYVRRYCVECVRSDVARYGTGYWHREAQLPGAVVCSLHGSMYRVDAERKLTI